jgi:polar amino acid transport system substrate-binding protein
MKKLIVILFLISIQATPVIVAQERPLKIMATPSKPNRYINESTNMLEGIDVEILDTVMKEIGIQYEIELIDAGTRIVEMAKRGNCDMVISFSKKESRFEYLIYPEQYYKTLKWNFFIRKSDEGKIKYNTFNDLKGLTIGPTKDYAYTKEFWDADLSLDVITTNDLQINKLIFGRIDAVPMNTFDTLYAAKLNGTQDKISYLKKPLKEKPYYNAFTKNSDYPQKEIIIKKYDETIAKLKNDGTIDKIFSKYLE